MSLTCYKYRLPFKTPLHTASGTFDHRAGLILHLKSSGQSFFGEAAPLPTFSLETLDEVIYWLIHHRNKIEAILSDERPYNRLIEFTNNQNPPPALQFGLDALALQKVSHLNEVSLQQQLFSKAVNQIPLNALGDLHADHCLKEVKSITNQGYKTIKFKVGMDIEHEIWQLHRIRKKHPKLSIRLDANQAWSPIAARHHCQKLEELNIEYCEEPLSEPTATNYRFLTEHTSLPLALDESTRQLNNWRELLSYSSAVILKPMLLGSFTTNLETKQLAETLDNKTVFSTSLESGIGRWFTAILASGSENIQTAHGLATGTLLTKDVYPDKPYIYDGSYHFDNRQRLRPDTNHLERVSERLF